VLVLGLALSHHHHRHLHHVYCIYISVIDEASDFKFGMQLEFAKALHQISLEEKWVCPWVRGAPRNLGLPL